MSYPQQLRQPYPQPPPPPSTGRRPALLRAGLLGLVLPGVVLGVVMGVVTLIRPSAILGAVTNPVVWAFLVGAGLIGGVLGLLIHALRAPVWSSFALFWIPVVAVTAYGVVPAFVDTTVNDAAPSALATTSQRTEAGDEGQASKGETGNESSAKETAQNNDEQQQQAVQLGRGSVVGIDHEASGSVKLYDVGERAVVRFENLNVEPGPDFRVWLVPGGGAQDPGAGVELGGLKANQGNQNYQVPDGVDIDGQSTVLIWCRAFQVPVAHASIG